MPLTSFFLDAEGYERCAGLLEVAGMRFVERRRSTHEAEPPVPAFTEEAGILTSSDGTFSCCCGLVACEGKYHFFVTGHGDKNRFIGIFDEVEKALAGHLLGRHVA
jgi:hypothetical protein